MPVPALLEKLFDALASLRLAVAIMLTLGGTCLAATFYESKHGTPAVQRDIYTTGWFAAILIMLGLNILCSMMKRWPFKSHHTGFVCAHIGILLVLGGSLVSLQLGLDGNLALFEGETGARVTLPEKALFAGTGAAPAVLPANFEKRAPKPGSEKTFDLGSGVTLVAEDWTPHARATDRYEDGGTEPFPVLQFTMTGAFGTQQHWLAARDPAAHQLDFGPASFAFHEGEDDAHQKPGANHLDFQLAADGSLRWRIDRRTGDPLTGPVVIGQTITTPWMGMTVTVDRFLPKAARTRTITAETPPEKEERRTPAVKVRVDGPQGRGASTWLLWGDLTKIPYPGGEATVAYRSPEVEMPFKVTLLQFKSDKYPGSRMAATYESRVRVDDPERGVSEHLVSMNHPLHWRGYIFFQASFVEGQPMMSVFSVARSPGLPLVYVGVVLITGGVVWMFYVKPWLAQRMAARALRAHRERERAQDVPGGGPEPAVPPPSPAEPAAGGA